MVLSLEIVLHSIRIAFVRPRGGEVSMGRMREVPAIFPEFCRR
jgi:hypothetical protein